MYVGGKLDYQTTKKRASRPKCFDVDRFLDSDTMLSNILMG